MKVLIIGNAKETAINKNAYIMIQKLKKYANVETHWIEKKDISQVGLDITQFDKIICMDHYYDKELNIQLNSLSNVFNKPKHVIPTVDKWITYHVLLNKVKQPKTYADSIHDLQFPIVLKNRYGSLGKNIEVAYNYDEYYYLRDKMIKDDIIATNFKTHIDEVLIYQEIIKSSWGKDLRVVLIGGKYVACELRENTSGAIQSNLAQGGTAHNYEITQEQIELCEKIANILQLDYVGIDMLFDENNNLVFCEANPCAFYEGITAVTGIDICTKHIDYILNNNPVD